MRALLLADLRALSNLFRHREGQRVLLSALVSLTFLLIVSALFGAVLTQHAAHHDLAREADPELVRALCGTLLAPGVLLALWFGFGSGHRQLFELPWMETLLAAAPRATTVLAGGYLRFAGITAIWCVALCGPALRMATLAVDAPVPWAAIVAACALLVLPAIAFVLVLQVVVMRWFAGFRSKRLLTAISALGSAGFSAILLVGALAQRDAARHVFDVTRARPDWPLLVEVPARLLAEASGPGVSADTAVHAAVLLLVAFALVAVAGSFYREAWTGARHAARPPRRPARRSWPSSTAAAVFRKELAQLLHQPNQLVGILLSTVVVVVLAATRFLGERLFAGLPLPETERHVLLLLALWLFAQLTIVPGCLMRLTLTDARQWSLYVVAPARPRAILAGKLGLIALLEAWPAVVAVVVARVVFDARWPAVLWFLGTVPAGVLWTTAATGCVGLLPGLMAPRPERGHLPALAAVLVMLFALQATVVPGVWLCAALVERAHGTGPFLALDRIEAGLAATGILWAGACVASALALALATRWFGAFARPERR